MSRQKNLLISLGLNDLEAEVYLLLLKDNALTGYKIGKSLGKPTANVYKAIESLSKKGAIVVEDKNSSLWKAVSINEFCLLIESGLKRKTAEAKKLLNKPKSESYDEKIYHLHSVDLVIEKSKNMLSRAKTVAMIDAFPKVVPVLIEDIKKAAGRGVDVYLQVYEPVEVKGARVLLIDSFQNVLQYWKSQQLNLIIDGQEHILALLDEEMSNVHQATWSRNLYLSSMLHMGFSNHYATFSIRQVTASKSFEKDVKKILEEQKMLSSGKIPGVEEMLQRLGIRD